ncbi:MAG TPA: ABC transporter permease [Gemmatimonadales bacterium]|nr:ABC transporter permease [Gemmatimonadales bacterium]
MPDWRAEIRQRLRGLGLDPLREAAIVEELAAALDDQFEELLARGLSPADAQERIRAEQLSGHQLPAALTQVERPASPSPVPPGGPGPGGPLAGWLSDLRYGARSLRRSPGLTTVALLTLALGIGATTAFFSMVNAVLLRPPPFERPSELVTFWGTAPEKGLPVVNYPDALYDYYRHRLRAADPIAMYTRAGFTLTGRGEALRLDGANVTVDFFRLLGVRPRLGRVFLPGEDRQGNNLVAVLSHGLWQARLGSDPAILGRTLMLNDIPTTVVGVMPPGFGFPGRTQLWIPLPIQASSLNCWCYDALGRLQPGRSREDLAREIDRLNVDFWAERERRPRPAPGEEPQPGTVVRPLAGELVSEVRTPVLVLLGAVGMVLLIACANLANLLLARSASRSREMAVRAALGASPRRIARQLLVESLLLSLSGAAVGLVLARGGIALLSRMAVERVSHLEPIGMDAAMLGFAATLGILTGLLFGFGPALRGSRVDLTGSLKDGGRSGHASATRRLNDVFVVAQLAISLVLLVGAGLLLRSFANLTGIDPGFRPANVLVGRISIPRQIYPEMAQVRQMAGQLQQRVQALPGVQSAGLSSTAPFSSNDNQQSLLVQGQEPGPDTPIPVASIRRVTPGYFEAVGTPLLEGRDFTPADGESGERVAIIDESVARRYWPGATALGRRINTGAEDNPTWRTVIGVAASIRHQSLSRAPDHYVYYPLAQDYAWTLDLVVRTESAPFGLDRQIESELKAIDPNLPFYDVHTLEDAVSRSLSTRRFTNRLLLGFALTAMLLAAIGIYGVMARNVTARIREFGVRLALGARPAQIQELVLRQAFRLVALGAVLGIGGALGATRFLRALLFEVNPVDPASFIAAVLLLTAAALAASWLPARRATSADPLDALRTE